MTLKKIQKQQAHNMQDKVVDTTSCELNADEATVPPEAEKTGDSRERIKAVNRILLARPRVSLRTQMYLGFLIPFILAAALAVFLVFNFSAMERKIRFLEIYNDYALEVEQARRFEKNFLLYGTNLDDALDNIFQAEQILTHNSGELSLIMGEQWLDMMLPRIHSYQSLLEKLGGLHGAKAPEEASAKMNELQKQVRREGQQLVSAAKALIGKEKASLAATTGHLRKILIYSLGVILFVMLLNAYLLGTRMLRSIKNLGNHAKMIAMGNFQPIMPRKRFRDEFTSLALAINTMVEEIEKREEILIQSHKMRAVGTLTAGVAHELNNPLNNITLTAFGLREDYDELDDEERRDMINDLVDEAARANKIIKNLLDFARETGTQLEPLDLPKLLPETINLAANQIRLMGIKIQFQCTDNLPRVHGDAQQLQQVFLNLILNAIDASGKGDKIQVLLSPADEPNYVAVKVIDFGVGIPEHILSSIFDPFFTTKAKGKGTGLGLSVSQGIVAKHGGRIVAHSQPGKGSVFSVLLPVTTIPAAIG